MNDDYGNGYDNGFGDDFEQDDANQSPRNAWETASAQGKILHALAETVLDIAADYDCDNVRVFGSVARGEAHDDSDIDLLVDIDDNDLEPGKLDDLADELEALLGYPVDVTTLMMMQDTSARNALRDASDIRGDE